MATDRFDLPDTTDGREQWADIERRPDRAQLRDIERGQRGVTTQVDADDAVILALVTEWQVYDRDGEPVPLKAGKLGRGVPADIIAALVDELNGVISGINRGKGAREIAGALRTLAWSRPPEDAERITAIIEELPALLGVTPPNATSQEGT